MENQLRKKTSFTLNEDCVIGLKHLSTIHNRSMSNMIETLVSEKRKNRKDEFFAHMDKKHKKIESQDKKK